MAAEDLWTTLHYAACRGDLQSVKQELSSGQDVNALQKEMRQCTRRQRANIQSWLPTP